eukprot:TRINITY_DN3596_c0_g1_i3.p1 TRINITY_DN3596_c0_g1~~TRINITY_DN3596_c0_g1_i3.p1  ORF type:complete len:1139 (+),score=260.54 TRINITY_DN3596_c0_g1_i3:31-3447(+)
MKPIVRTYVSGDRRRYKGDGTNLDLTYIQDKIVAMSFPASGFIETVWRNSIHSVGAFLIKNHGDNFMVFNVSERSYNGSKMKKQMIHIPFADHHPPPLVQLFEIVSMIDAWLLHPDHVAVVHCVGGKGRTGTIISALMFYSCMFNTMEESAAHFATSRSVAGRGVTQPSQIRYLTYFESFLIGEMLNFCPVMFKQFILVGLVKERYTIEIYDSPWNGRMKYQCSMDYENSQGPLIFPISLQIYGDIYITCKVGKRTVFRSCLHTYFINEDNIVFNRPDIDGLDDDFVVGTSAIQLAMTFSQVENTHHRKPHGIFVKALKEFKSRRALSSFGPIPSKFDSVSPRSKGEVTPHQKPDLPPPPVQGFTAPKLARSHPPATTNPSAVKPTTSWDKRSTGDSPRTPPPMRPLVKRERFPTMQFESLLAELESEGVKEITSGRDTVRRKALPVPGEKKGLAAMVSSGGEEGSLAGGRFETLMRRIERYSVSHAEKEEEEDDEVEEVFIPEKEEDSRESDSWEEIEEITELDWFVTENHDSAVMPIIVTSISENATNAPTKIYDLAPVDISLSSSSSSRPRRPSASKVVTKLDQFDPDDFDISDILEDLETPSPQQLSPSSTQPVSPKISSSSPFPPTNKPIPPPRLPQEKLQGLQQKLADLQHSRKITELSGAGSKSPSPSPSPRSDRSPRAPYGGRSLLQSSDGSSRSSTGSSLSPASSFSLPKSPNNSSLPSPNNNNSNNSSLSKSSSPSFLSNSSPSRIPSWSNSPSSVQPSVSSSGLASPRSQLIFRQQQLQGQRQQGQRQQEQGQTLQVQIQQEQQEQQEQEQQEQQEQDQQVQKGQHVQPGQYGKQWQQGQHEQERPSRPILDRQQTSPIGASIQQLGEGEQRGTMKLRPTLNRQKTSPVGLSHLGGQKAGTLRGFPVSPRQRATLDESEPPKVPNRPSPRSFPPSPRNGTLSRPSRSRATLEEEGGEPRWPPQRSRSTLEEESEQRWPPQKSRATIEEDSEYKWPPQRNRATLEEESEQRWPPQKSRATIEEDSEYKWPPQRNRATLEEESEQKLPPQKIRATIEESEYKWPPQRSRATVEEGTEQKWPPRKRGTLDEEGSEQRWPPQRSRATLEEESDQRWPPQRSRATLEGGEQR